MATIANVYLCDRKPAIDPGCGLSSLIKLRRLRFEVARNIAAIGRAVCQMIRNTLSRDSVKQISCGVVSLRENHRREVSLMLPRHRKYANMRAFVRVNNFSDKKFLI